MNKKGFTLVELLGVIVILSIIMLIAIPNITSVLDRTKKDNYIADCKKMVSLAQYKLRNGDFEKPNVANASTIITLDDLDTDDIVRDTDGYLYDLNLSNVKVVNENGFLVYYVQLLAPNKEPKEITPENGGKKSYRGIVRTNSDELDGDNRYQLYKRHYVPQTN